MGIERKMVKSLSVVIFNIVSFMKQWKVSLSTKEQDLVTVACRVIKKKTGKVSKAGDGCKL
jgi:hypothetical protein